MWSHKGLKSLEVSSVESQSNTNFRSVNLLILLFLFSPPKYLDWREGGREGGKEGGRERGRERGREGGREGEREGERERGREGVSVYM